MSEATLPRAAKAMLARDLRLAWRRRGDTLQPLLFAILVVAMFPLALGSERARLAMLAPGAIWVAALLASLQGLDSLFRSDVEDGSLEQQLLAPVPLSLLLGCRMLAHWLTGSLPLLLIVPLLGQLLFLPNALLAPLLLSLLMGTPLLVLLGSMVAALTVGMRRSGMLLPLLALPLYVPVLVFGAGSVMAAAQGQDWLGAVLLLAAGLVLAIVLAPLAAAAAIRIALP
ncbi:MAG TPA: heme exporter protein CcmB [Xanthomonadaceae bacterium]|jgi:heme exporter protein B|nr:heme exporter protein CcmB [Xanthomonadaceae bacterium]